MQSRKVVNVGVMMMTADRMIVRMHLVTAIVMTTDNTGRNF